MRLVDADGFIEKFAMSPLVQEAMRKALNHMPTVEVVRCKDCKHNYHNMIPGGEAEYGCTKCIELPITADFYCALGERKDDK